MKAARFTKPLHTEVVEIPQPTIGPDDVLIRVKAAAERILFLSENQGAARGNGAARAQVAREDLRPIAVNLEIAARAIPCQREAMVIAIEQSRPDTRSAVHTVAVDADIDRSILADQHRNFVAVA